MLARTMIAALAAIGLSASVATPVSAVRPPSPVHKSDWIPVTGTSFGVSRIDEGPYMWGHSVTIRGWLSVDYQDGVIGEFPEPYNQVVRMEFRPAGSEVWTTTQTLMTDDDSGDFRLEYHHPSNGDIRFVMEATELLPKTVSQPIRMPVRITGVTQWKTPKVAKVGQKVVMTAVIKPSNKRKVILQINDKKKRKRLGPFWTDSKGNITLTWTPTGKGKHWVKIEPASDHLARVSWNYVKVITVK